MNHCKNIMRESVDIQLKKDIYKYMVRSVILTTKKFLGIHNNLATVRCFRIDLGMVKNILSMHREKEYSFHKSRKEKFVFTPPNQFMKFLSSASM